ncbi:MAG: 4-hydroxy-tetrahydrodipicolinate reductase [Deltaproteobacteria bacterium]|nr:MAG: 4-hydroxy-tetrahydrodipicolinate reductase [Deltaproteobacteria bacterium]
MSTQIVVHGAAGRMGQRIVALSTEGEFQVVGAVDHSEHPLQGQDIGEAAGVKPLNVSVSSELNLEQGQVVIDFSHPSVLQKVVDAALSSKASLVCGTTGLSPEQIAILEEAGKQIPVLFSPNMSVGVNLLFVIAEQVARSLGEDWDTEVMEIHHRFKKDAPSGTAIRLAQHIADGRDLSLEEKGRYSREGGDCERQPLEIGVQSLRGGDIPGEHTAFFCGFGERIELTHRALTRDIFARGALRAASWLDGKPAGFYNMFNVLGMER